jgi:hypothetical protein
MISGVTEVHTGIAAQVRQFHGRCEDREGGTFGTLARRIGDKHAEAETNVRVS